MEHSVCFGIRVPLRYWNSKDADALADWVGELCAVVLHPGVALLGLIVLDPSELPEQEANQKYAEVIARFDRLSDVAVLPNTELIETEEFSSWLAPIIYDAALSLDANVLMDLELRLNLPQRLGTIWTALNDALREACTT
jgi:hypothetical protein